MTDADLLAQIFPVAERAVATEKALALLVEQLLDLIVAHGGQELRTKALRVSEDALARMKEHIP